MKVAIVCATAYHVFTALNIRKYILKDNNLFVDLFIWEHFKDGPKIAARIKELNIFDNVFSYDSNSNLRVCDSIKFLKNFALVLETLFPIFLINKMILDDVHLKCKYDVIYTGEIGGIALPMALMQSKSGKFYYFEDGLGSYFEDLRLSSNFSVKHILFIKLLGKYKRISSNALYMYRPDFCTVDTWECMDLYPADKFIYENRELLYDIFNVDCRISFNEKKCIYLDQPLTTDGQHLREVMNVLRKYSKNVVVRPHPRQIEAYYDDFCIDNSSVMWELVCYKQVFDETILIANFSTAQFTPKLLFDLNPYLIFTYKLNSIHLSYSDMCAQDHIVDLLRKYYSDAKKIFVPETLEELDLLIKKLIENNSINCNNKLDSRHVASC